MLAYAPPGAVTVFRKYYPPDEQLERARDPIQGWYVANEIVRDLRGFTPTFVEVFNEIAPTLETGLVDYCAFLQHAVWRLHELGFKVSGFSFPTGNGEEADWLYLKSRNYCDVDSLNLHQYWGNEGFTEWNALRHRKVHTWTGGQHPPILIGECGRDHVEGSPGGWHAGNVSDDAYVGELLAYDALLAEDDYVIGAVVFTTGPTPDWVTYEVDSISSRIVPSDGGDQEEPPVANTYTWAPGAEAAANSRSLNKAFGPAVVTSTYADLYGGLGVDPSTYEKEPGDILRVEQLVGVDGEDRPRGKLEYTDTAPGDGWDAWVYLPFE